MASGTKLDLTVVAIDGQIDRQVDVSNLVIAGWTGRDAAAVEAHIRELEALGVARPKSAPIFYRVSASLLTTADSIQVSGDASSGEVETVIFETEAGRLVGVGSDHTDRQAETINVSLSKQMCAKPVAPIVWRWDDVADHWDSLVLRSWALGDGERSLYQEGSVTAMRPTEELIGLYGGLAPATAMFGGTLAVHGGVRAASGFEMELHDPVLNRSIRHRYGIETLPVEG